MDNQKKAEINAIVKQIKASRTKKDGEEKSSGLKFQVSSSPEKILIGTGIAAGLAIIFDDAKKRKKDPKKARPFYKRCYDNYKKIEGVIDSTVAYDLKKKSQRQFKDDKLENMTIENGIKFDL
jgi:hypothetical protein